MFDVISINNEPSSTLSSDMMIVKVESNCLIDYRYSFTLIGLFFVLSRKLRGELATQPLSLADTNAPNKI